MKMAEVFGAHGEFVEKPQDIRPALERASVGQAGGGQRDNRPQGAVSDDRLRQLPGDSEQFHSSAEWVTTMLASPLPRTHENQSRQPAHR